MQKQTGLYQHPKKIKERIETETKKKSVCRGRIHGNEKTLEILADLERKLEWMNELSLEFFQSKANRNRNRNYWKKQKEKEGI